MQFPEVDKLGYIKEPVKYVFDADILIYDTTGDNDKLDEIEHYEITVSATDIDRARQKAEQIVKELVDDFNITEIDDFARAEAGGMVLDSREGVELIDVEKIDKRSWFEI